MAGAGLASLLAACGDTNAAPAATVAQRVATSSATTQSTAAATAAPAAQAVGLTVLGGGSPEQQAVINQAIKLFEAQHPGVHVVSANPANTNNKLDTLIAAGTPPSTFTLQPFDMPSYVVQGALYPIDAFVASAHYDLTDFYPKALNQYYWQGKLYGLPRGFGNQDLYWNVDMFSKAGAPAPAAKWADPAWTTDTFLNAAQRLTVRTGGAISQYGYAQGFGLRQWEPWVWLFGGSVIDAENRKFLLGDATAITGLQFLADLMYKHQVMATPAELKKQALQARFGANTLAMAMDIPASLTTYRKLKAPAWDVAPLPTAKGTVTSGGGLAWMMIAGSAQPDLTWDLVGWMASKQVQTLECAAATTAPPRQSVAASSCYNDPNQAPKHMNVFLEAPTYVHADPLVVKWTALDAILQPGLAPIFNGTKSAHEVLPPLTQQLDGLIKNG
ncbi:MAG TPA: sugar ABC transporter substrate-binding protein [Chloroflexota bacterium]|nr:sugar ABC transporter substrate-binding protein [Chloroflexota bacterium]